MANSNVREYSDFDINFINHPLTGDIIKLKNEQEVVNSCKNILCTQFNEKLFKPNFGSPILKYLFEPNLSVLRIALRNDIMMALKNYEPRVNVMKVDIEATEDDMLLVNIIVKIINNTNPIKISLFLERIRG